jgi:hypothetical protein
MGKNLEALRAHLGILVLSISVLSTAASGQTRSWQANVAQDQVALSSAPSTQGRVLTKLPVDENVGILLKLRIHDEDWCKVRVLATSAVGYVHCDALKPGKSNPSSKPLQVSSNISAVLPAPTATAPAAKPHVLAADQPASLTNKDVLALNKVGLSSDALVVKIKSSNCSFDTSPNALQELKLQHVPDAVILAMLQAPQLLLAATPQPTLAKSSAEGPANLIVAVSRQPVMDGKIPAGSKIFIEPMDGFESFLAAALEKKKVPLVVVNDPQLAEFTIGGNSDSKKAGWAKIVFMGNLHSDEEASITMVNAKTHAVVFAYAVNKKNTLHGEQTSAEACAKHLKQKMEGHE